MNDFLQVWNDKDVLSFLPEVSPDRYDFRSSGVGFSSLSLSLLEFKELGVVVSPNLLIKEGSDTGVLSFKTSDGEKLPDYLIWVML